MQPHLLNEQNVVDRLAMSLLLSAPMKTIILVVGKRMGRAA